MMAKGNFPPGVEDLLQKRKGKKKKNKKKANTNMLYLHRESTKVFSETLNGLSILPHIQT